MDPRVPQLHSRSFPSALDGCPESCRQAGSRNVQQVETSLESDTPIPASPRRQTRSRPERPLECVENDSSGKPAFSGYTPYRGRGGQPSHSNVTELTHGE